MRIVAILAGVLLLASATWAVIDASNLTGSHAVLVAAMAAGTATGAVVLARSSFSVGLVLFVAVFCGESFGMIATAERIITAREATQKPARDAAQARTQARDRLRVAETNLEKAATSSRRLSDAVAAKSRADDAVISKAGERNCAANCRALLAEAATSAEREVDEARKEIEHRRGELRAEVERARAELSSIKDPSNSGTALADRLGMAPWLLDVVSAGLLTIGANLLGGVLIAWGAHGGGARRVEPEPQHMVAVDPVAAVPVAIVEPTAVEVVEERRLEVQRVPRRKSATVHAVSFARARLRHREGSLAPFPEIHSAYREWCSETGEEPHVLGEIVPAIQKALVPLGVRGVMIDDVPHVRDVAIVKAA